MLEEFILEQLHQLAVRKDELSVKLRKLTDEEEKENKSIQEILSKDTFSYDLFSPRSVGKGIKQEIAIVQQKIDELRYQQAEVREKLEEISAGEEKYQKLLYEARTSGTDPIYKGTLSEKTDEKQQHEREDDQLTGDEFNQITLKLVDDDGVIRAKEEYRSQLEIILQRVDTCYDLSLRDHIQCRNELKNLQYYLKALISDIQQ